MKLGFEHNLGICCVCTYYRFENDTVFIDLGSSRLKLGFQKDLGLFVFCTYRFENDTTIIDLGFFSFEIRVSKLFGEKSISGFFAFVDMVSKQF